MSNNEIWVLAELRDGKPTRTTLQLIGAARELAEAGGLTAVTVLCSPDGTGSDDLAALSPKVLQLNDPGFDPFESTRFADALGQLFESRGTPAAVLGPASSSGLELLPRLAARCGSGYAGSCVGLRLEDGALVAKRPVYGGRVYEEVALPATPAFCTVRPGAFTVAEPLAAAGAVESVSVSLGAASVQVVDRQATGSGGVDVSEAARVVCGGRGLGSAEAFGALEALAETLDGAVGASRSVVDAGWRPHDEQVGKSGKTVSPELYVAAGISGAIHHVLGMNTSKVVVAINSDPDALIFENADYGLVGDATEIIPALNEALKSS